MASPTIKIKRSSVAGKVPHYPTTLDVGEFAINTADGKVFIAAGVGAGVTVREVGISTAQVLASGIGTFSSLVITDEGHAIAGISTGSARVETATDAGNQWHHVGFFDNRTGYQKVKTNGLTYNPNTGKLYAGIGSFGNVTASGTLDVDGATTLDGLTNDGDATFNGDVYINSTSGDSSAGPILDFYRNSASAADADYLGQIKFQGENDAGQKIVYSKITGKILDASDGTEDGILEFAFKKAGSNNISGRFRSDSLQLLNGTNFTVAGESTFTGVVNANHGLTGNVNSSGISTISGFTFPSTDGSEDQALVTDGNGSLSFKTLSGGGGGAVGGATTISASNTIATMGQTAFTAPNVFDDGEQATAFSVLVTLNGVKMRQGASADYQLSAPQTVNFNSGVNIGDNVQITVYFGHTFEEELFTATQNQATFTLAGSLAAAKNYRVYLNGVRLRRDIDYQASAAVVLAQACAAGDEVDICSDQAEDQLTASDGQSAFAPSNSDTSSDNMEVYLNGVLLQKTVDWTIGSPAVTIINPATGLDVGDELDVVVRRS
jgi:hypothetical protein